MKINNINKKLIAGILAIALTTTGCDARMTGRNSWLEYEQSESGKMVCNDSMTYDQASRVKVVYFEYNEKKAIHLAYLPKDVDALNREYIGVYYNVFGGQVLYDETDETELKILEESNLTDYLVIYDRVQSSYTEEELKEILEQIKADFELQQADKQLVIGN